MARNRFPAYTVPYLDVGHLPFTFGIAYVPDGQICRIEKLIALELSLCEVG